MKKARWDRAEEATSSESLRLTIAEDDGLSLSRAGIRVKRLYREPRVERCAPIVAKSARRYRRREWRLLNERAMNAHEWEPEDP